MELAAISPEARDVFAHASDAVGIDILRLCKESDEETLRQTQNAQLALFTAGVAAFSALSEPLRELVGAAAGHSIGEYAAAVAAGALTLEDGARLVRIRGELMAEAGKTAPGAMAAVLGLDRSLLEEACAETDGVVVIANDNSPGQLVISGEADAVARAGEIAKAKGAKRAITLNVSGAFHSPLMREAAAGMGESLRGIQFPTPRFALYMNVTAEPLRDASELPGLLERQLSSPVRWTECVRNMVRDGVDTFVECGVGEVLSGLIRRIEPSVLTLSLNDGASLAAVIAALSSS